MMRGKSENGITDIVLPESFVADQVGDAVDHLKSLSRLLENMRQREAANVASDAAEWLNGYARKIDVVYDARRRNYHATAIERMMQD